MQRAILLLLALCFASSVSMADIPKPLFGKSVAPETCLVASPSCIPVAPNRDMVLAQGAICGAGQQHVACGGRIECRYAGQFCCGGDQICMPGDSCQTMLPGSGMIGQRCVKK